jgi:hypothetical protein
MEWAVEDYVEALSGIGPRCSGKQTEIESRLRCLFPPGATETIIEPCVVVDSKGIVLLWFLPGLLHPRRQVGKQILAPTDNEF